MKRFPMFLCALLLLLAACGGKKTLKKVGEFCSGDSDCVSGLCFESVCLDPDADDDGDGLKNGIEVWQLGTNPTKSDTDDDGIGDFEEVGNISAPYDKDGDGLSDAIESRIADADKDCIPDEYDPQNEVPDVNAEKEIAKIHCTKQGGVCIEFLEHIKASCVEGVPQCDYGEVFGYEETESLCDGKDNDCDGETDEGLVSLTEGECSTQGVCAGVQIERICLNGAWVCKYEAIPDWEPLETRLDGLDNDCNGQTDEHVVGEPCKRENEYGSCAGTYVLYENRAMCDSPEPALEQCDGKDNDCNGETDEEGADGCVAYYADRDKDGFGSSENRCLCAPQEPYTAKIAGDCNDLDASVYPGATETCNGVDDNCDGAKDEENAFGCILYFADADKDGFGSSESRCLCAPQEPYTAKIAGDCNDLEASVNPGATETCNGVDDNCNDQTDEGGVCTNKGTVKGNVLDGQTLKPVSGALVEVYVVQEGRGETLVEELETDLGGKFSTDLDPGIYFVRVTAPQYREIITWSFTLDKGDVSPLHIALTPQASSICYFSICGRVVDASASVTKPIEGASVTLFGGSFENPLASTTSGPQGFFCIYGVSTIGLDGYPFPQLMLRAVKPGYLGYAMDIQNDCGMLPFVWPGLSSLPPDARILFTEDFEDAKTAWTYDEPVLNVGWNWLSGQSYNNLAAGTCVYLPALNEMCTPGDDGTGECAICASATQPACIPEPGSLPRPVSGNGAVWFGNPKTGNYLTTMEDCQPVNGGGNAEPVRGSLTSPVFKLGGVKTVALGFYSAWEVEHNSSAEYDQMVIEVQYDGADWILIGRLNAQVIVESEPTQPYTSAGFNKAPIWVYYVFGLSPPPTAQEMAVRFTFDSRDGQFNGFRGWMVDMVEVLGW